MVKWVNTVSSNLTDLISLAGSIPVSGTMDRNEALAHTHAKLSRHFREQVAVTTQELEQLKQEHDLLKKEHSMTKRELAIHKRKAQPKKKK